MSPLVGPLLLATGLVLCVTSVRALRMVMAHWNGRIAAAHSRPMGHVVWRSFDTFAVSLWCVVYAAGGLAVVAGLLVLKP